MIPAQPTHHCERLTYLISILGIYAWRCLVCVRIITQVVVVEAKTGREVVVLIKIGLEHQRSIAVALIGIVTLVAIAAPFMMNRATQDQGDVRHEFRVQDEGVLGKSLVALIGDVDEIRIVGRVSMSNLSALAMLLQSLDGELKHIRVTDIGPSAHE